MICFHLSRHDVVVYIEGLAQPEIFIYLRTINFSAYIRDKNTFYLTRYKIHPKHEVNSTEYNKKHGEK